MNTPKLSGIDHFHLYVADKKKSFEWYQSILGFTVYEPFKFWDDDKGPLTIEDSSRTIHLALFTKTDQPPSSSIAFKATGKEFIKWKEHLVSKGLNLRVADHTITWSMYFKDIDDNVFEITTYDYELVSSSAL